METLKKYADFALYQVKHSHKGCLQEFSMESYRREAQTAQLRRDFQQLLTEERVYYVFQPIFSAHDGRVMAYEALMRSDMERLRSPATIMKLAREQGALQEIERLTFFKSLETFDHLRSEGLVRWMIMAAATPTRAACWSFRPGSSRWISPSSAASTPTPTNSRSCRTSWLMPTRAACRSLPRAWRRPRS